MKIFVAVVIIALLATIAAMIYQHEARAEESRKEHARRAAAYLDCMTHAKYPDLCRNPD